MSRTGTAQRPQGQPEGRDGWWPGLGLLWRLILYVGLSLAVLLTTFAFFSFQGMRQAEEFAFSQQVSLAQAMASGLEQEFQAVDSVVRTYFPQAPHPDLAASPLFSLRGQLMAASTMRYFRVSSVRLVDSQGQPHPGDSHAAATSDTMPSPETIRQAVATGQTIMVPSRLAAGGNPPLVALIMPLSSTTSAPQGAVVVVDTAGLSGISLLTSTGGAAAEQDGQASSERFYGMEILRTDGTVLATWQDAWALGSTSMHYPIIAEFLANGQSGASVHRGLEEFGHPAHVVASTPLRGTPYFVVLEEHLGLLVGWRAQIQRQGIILGATAVLIVLGLGWLIARHLVRPVHALRTATARISSGDLDTPVRVAAQGELGVLAQEVETMRQRLQETISSLDDLNTSLADQVQERTHQLRTVVQRMMQAQEEERHRVARDLHDETAQGLIALGVILDQAARESRNGGEKALESIRTSREQVTRLVSETRRLAYALRPSVLDDAGLVPALRWCAEAYLEPNGVAVSLQAQDREQRFPEAVEVALFRVGQEAMSNIAKHARASQAWVTLEPVGGWVILTVRDNGVGFDAAQFLETGGLAPTQGLGLAGMRERIDILGGDLKIDTRPGAGTVIRASVPLRPWGEQQP